MLARFTLTTAALIAAGVAQSQVVVHSGSANKDATGNARAFPGTFLRSRQQILIGQSLLSGLVTTQSITAVSFRRDGNDLDALAAGTAQLALRISANATPIDRASPDFAANHGTSSTLAFQGSIRFPASPTLTHRDEPDWSPQHSFTIPFTTPLPYSGGSLCLDLEATPTQSTRWPLDYHADLARGSLVRYGSACGPIAAVSTRTLRASDWSLRPGATARLAVMGERSSFGLLMLAAAHLDPGLDLAAIGAPGCVLHLDPLVSLTAAVTVRPGRAVNHPGIGAIGLDIPNAPEFVAAHFFAQWANIKDLRLTTSDAARVQLANALAPFDAATVTSPRADGLPMPTRGDVLPGHMPVMRLSVQ
jgi:hypothetical protein